jgi:hypothetical protein
MDAESDGDKVTEENDGSQKAKVIEGVKANIEEKADKKEKAKGKGAKAPVRRRRRKRKSGRAVNEKVDRPTSWVSNNCGSKFRSNFCLFCDIRKMGYL